jgi:hypothetical protein
MPLSNYALDNYVSQQIMQLTECNAIDLSQEFDQADSWIENFVLNSIFRTQVKQEYKPFIFAILRRAQMALVEYENGRMALQDYAGGNKNRISVYFRSLYHFEIAVNLTYQAHYFFMKITKKRLFNKNDGSQLERLNRINNVSKHLELSTIPNSYLHAVWLSNEGLCISSANLKFEELADMVKDICKLADKLSNPQSPDQESTA